MQARLTATGLGGSLGQCQGQTATGLGGSLGQCEGHGRDKAGSTPPVVPGAAPALAKAGVGDFLGELHCLRPVAQVQSW